MAGQTDLLRILDANANRAGEGLRVVEEYLRFVLEDEHLTAMCKQLRHDLQGSLDRLGPDRLAARDAVDDVGAGISTEQESRRSGSRDIAAASLKRVEQALRCLEEYAKPLDEPLASEFERLRYRAYSLSRAVLTTADSIDRLSAAVLYLLIDGAESSEAFAGRLDALARRVDVVQLRDKRLVDRVLLQRARQTRAITREAGTLLVINDRPDLAVLCGADGVHLGQDDLSVRDARRIVGADLLIGVSTHTPQQARQAVLEGANYIGCGPTFPSRTKEFAEFSGLEFLRIVATDCRIPSFAIGGISPDNLGEVLACGFHRVAVSGSVIQAADAPRAAEQLRAALRRAEPARRD